MQLSWQSLFKILYHGARIVLNQQQQPCDSKIKLLRDGLRQFGTILQYFSGVVFIDFKQILDIE